MKRIKHLLFLLLTSTSWMSSKEEPESVRTDLTK